MQPKRMVVASTALCAAVVVACSSTKPGEDTKEARSADARTSLGSAEEPNDCGAYMGDAAFPLGSTLTPAMFGGEITSAGSPMLDGWFGPPATLEQGAFDTHSCDTPNPTPTVRDRGLDIHYDEIFLKNWTDADACISVWGGHLDHLDAGYMEVGAYVGAFDPNDIVKNNVAAWQRGQGIAHFSFKVPASTAFEVVVIGEAPYAADGTRYAPVDINWGLDIANCGVEQSGGGSSSGGDDDAGNGGGKSW